MKPPRIASSYAIVDITKGRKALAKHIKKHGPVSVVIHATLDGEYGRDDGTSIEFNATVTCLALSPT
jgi:hypothetical protein